MLGNNVHEIAARILCRVLETDNISVPQIDFKSCSFGHSHGTDSIILAVDSGTETIQLT